jgi:NAD(P)H-hydrate epimerase
MSESRLPEASSDAVTLRCPDLDAYTRALNPSIPLRVATSEEMRELDRRATAEFNLPALLLMENAGAAVAREAVHLLQIRLSSSSPRPPVVVVVAGRGNNGGDGFVAARHLQALGCQVTVTLAGAEKKVQGNARANLEMARAAGIKLEPISAAPERFDADLIIDALLGTGLKGAVTGLAAELIAAMNRSSCPVLAVDVPSGLEADTGRADIAVQAAVTVTFALPKVGLLCYPGKAHAGDLVVASIGMPRPLLEEDVSPQTYALDRHQVRALLPDRPPDANKGTFGRALIIAGSEGMTGAAALAAEGAGRIGAGLVFVAVPQSLLPVLEQKLTEALKIGLPETPTRAHTIHAWDTLAERLASSTALAVGPGLGRHPDTVQLVRRLLKEAHCPVVIDADGLNAVAPAGPDTFPAHSAITPHPGEMGRLMGLDTAQVQADRLQTAREAATRFGCVVVLKGAGTVVAEPGGTAWINPTGNAGLATGGTGDVLTGALVGLLAQGLSPLDAARAAVYLHGLAGELAAAEIGDAGTLAGDLLPRLPAALRLVSGQHD